MAFWNVPNRVVSVQGENGFELYGDFQCDSVSDLTDKRLQKAVSCKSFRLMMLHF